MEFLYSLRRLKRRDVPTEVRLRPRGVTEAVRARVPSAEAEYAIPLRSGAWKREVIGVKGFEPAIPDSSMHRHHRDLSNLDGWYALFAYQLCTSHNQKFLQSLTSDRCEVTKPL
jgi:hypothetical protein